ncbi:HAD-IIA family hydrolase [Arachnia propionica]|uniref:HAD-IIA family hydrolase n=1 Tax=Arachnia propionica TaxID=1750 RepID=UPI0030CCAAB7
MTPLVSSYDAALFDLDGVIYLGPNAIDGVAGSLTQLRERGIRLGFVTNNAARTPTAVAEHLRQLGIRAEDSDVVNSTQAMVRMLRKELPTKAKVLVVGTDALAAQLADGGFVPVSTLEENPVAVVQGYHPQLPWALLELGAIAIQKGAAWYATNPDQTRPTERGILPGCGAQVDLIADCVGFRPSMAGKPFRPLLDETVLRLAAKRPVFVGDRIDTDIIGAGNVGMDSLFVFTGAHGKYDLAAADPIGRPTHIGYDISALLAPAREVETIGNGFRCRDAEAWIIDGRVVTDIVPEKLEGQLDLLWCVLNAVWRFNAEGNDVLARLDLLR